MADYDSSLPVRTQNPGDVISKIADATVPSQQLAVDAVGLIGSKVYDSSGASITLGQKLMAASLPVVLASDQSTLIVSDLADGPAAPGIASAFSILIGGQYNATPLTLTDTQQAAIAVDVNGRLILSPSVSANVTVTNLPAVVDTDYGVVGASTLRSASQIGNATGAANFGVGASGAQTLRVEANQGAAALIAGAWPFKLTDGTDTADITAASALKVDGSAVTQPVSGTVTALQGTSPWVENLTQVGGGAISLGQKAMAASFPVVIASDQSPVSSNISQVSGVAVSAANPLPSRLSDGTAFYDDTNPLPVKWAIEGTPVNDYKDAASVVAGASDNHDYTVTAGKTLLLSQVEASGSGKAKMVISVETGVATGVFTTRFVQFNSTADTNMSIVLADPISVAAGVRVRIVMSNRDLLAQDLYSTICGSEL